jgi:hypothetical protein
VLSRFCIEGVPTRKALLVEQFCRFLGIKKTCGLQNQNQRQNETTHDNQFN